jgi:hypothetical protein
VKIIILRTLLRENGDEDIENYLPKTRNYDWTWIFNVPSHGMTIKENKNNNKQI